MLKYDVFKSNFNNGKYFTSIKGRHTSDKP